MAINLFIQKYPDYHSRLKALHTLIYRRGDHTANLTKSELEEYESLCEWYHNAHNAA